jgi:hypothetical protein
VESNATKVVDWAAKMHFNLRFTYCGGQVRPQQPDADVEDESEDREECNPLTGNKMCFLYVRQSKEQRASVCAVSFEHDHKTNLHLQVAS